MEKLKQAVMALDAVAEVMESPDALASVFCDMDAEQQAKFFDRVARLSAEWPNASMQWHWMRQQMSTGGLKLLSDFVER